MIAIFGLASLVGLLDGENEAFAIAAIACLVAALCGGLILWDAVFATYGMAFGLGALTVGTIILGVFREVTGAALVACIIVAAASIASIVLAVWLEHRRTKKSVPRSIFEAVPLIGQLARFA